MKRRGQPVLSSPDPVDAGARNWITEVAKPKVNLTLHVGPPKTNGRHDLRSLVVFPDVDVVDRIKIRAADALHLRVTGAKATHMEGPPEDNLVLLAARALADSVGRPPNLEIELEKNLPVAAGIGGGSADAGATLRAIERLWDLESGSSGSIASRLGGDGLVAYLSRTAMMEGEGERVTELLDVEVPPMVLVNPGVACPTGPIFAAYDSLSAFPPLGEGEPPGRVEDLIGWVTEGRNDLETPAKAMLPVVADLLTVLREMNGVRVARMSGSGATCFALFGSAGEAAAACTDLRSKHPEWWVAGPAMVSKP